MKAAVEAQSREQRAIRATTIFFWFFSYEKEKNERDMLLPLCLLDEARGFVPLLFYDSAFSASHVLRFSAYAYPKKKPNREEKRIKGCRSREFPCVTNLTDTLMTVLTDTLMTVSDLTQEADTDILHLALST
ncbi:hypothetical protein WCX72_11480 [Sulfurimonas sp. HSL1-6]|uniref:hypothetical protein n=1 Tax=Thiomicrolovo immobilis TaxID=3131935 RepID=UPI0031F961BE